MGGTIIKPGSPLAVVLLSGGLDSAVVAMLARQREREVHVLTFLYGQRHLIEVKAARRVARSIGVERHVEIELDPRAFAASSLTGECDVPKGRSDDEIAGGIPSTYVPARNLVFLSMAGAYAQSIGAEEIHIGVNAIDYSGYPDCRPQFIKAYQEALRLATPAADGGLGITVCTPIIDMTKAQIICIGVDLGVDFSLTHSCYDPDERGAACGACDSCILRRRGFEEAGLPDPTRYATEAAR